MPESLGQIREELAAAANPFWRQVIQQPWETAPADVPEINDAAFRRCLDAVEQARRSGASSAVLLHGGVGTGKTHLIARFRTALASQEEDAEPVFVYVLLAAGASRLRRLIREQLVDSLYRPWRGYRSRLEGLLRRATADRPWEETALALGLSHSVETVLGHVLANRFPGKARAWLRGESLHDSVLDMLGLKDRPEWEEADHERNSFELIRALCQLAIPLPVVFCFDQAEALRTAADDRHGFFVFGQAAAEMRNAIPNVVLITAIQTGLMTEFQDAVAHEANYQRLGVSAVLKQVTEAQALALVEKRLAAEPVVQALRQREAKSGVWPLEARHLETAWQAGNVPARRLLFRAAELFEQLRDGKLLESETTPDQYLEEKRAEFEKTSAAWSGPEHTDAILEHGLPVLAGLMGTTAVTGANNRVTLDASAASIIACGDVNQTAFAKRVVKLAETGEKGLTLVRDVRLEIKRTPRADEALRKLEAADARWVRPTPEAMAALDALRRLHDGYGTLSHRGESFTAESVADWLRENMSAPLAQFARELLGGSAQPSETVASRPPVGGLLLEKLSEELVMSAADLAARLAAPVEDVIAYAQSHSSQVLLVSGPHPVVCLVAGQMPEDSADAD